MLKYPYMIEADEYVIASLYPPSLSQLSLFFALALALALPSFTDTRTHAHTHVRIHALAATLSRAPPYANFLTHPQTWQRETTSLILTITLCQ